MKFNRDQIDGDWQAVSGILAGQAMADEVVSATKLSIAQDTYSVNLAGNIDSGSCAIQDDAWPLKMKIQSENGPNAGKTFYAILELLDSEQMRIAYDLSGTDYPDSFEPTLENTSYVATFQRCSD